MAALVKRAFGLITFLLGAALALIAVGHGLIRPDEPFELGVFIGGLFWGLVFLYFGRKWLFNQIDLDVIPVEPESPELADARRRALSSIGVLWHYLDENRHECFVKFPMETKSGSIEHIWGVVHSRQGDKVVVSLANEPVEAPSGEADRRTVAIRDIEDWQVFVSESEIRGGYSVGALARIAKSRGYGLSRSNRKHLEKFVDLEAV